MPDDVLVKVSKVLDKGLVQIPLEMREKLDLQPGTKMIVYATEDAVALRITTLFINQRAKSRNCGWMVLSLRGRLRSSDHRGGRFRRSL